MQKLDAALSYARMGLKVFPTHDMASGRCSCGEACKSPGKHPRVKRGLLEATSDEATIRAWWGQWPTANIAVRPEGFFIVDIDTGERLRPDGTRTKKVGKETMAALEAKHGPLRSPVVQLTGGGGEHRLFRLPEGGKAPRSPGEDIDIRGPGGYILVAPSDHESGREYRWDGSSIEDLPFIWDLMPEAPKWLVYAIRAEHDFEDDAFLAQVKNEPKSFTPRQIERILSNLPEPYLEKYEPWLTVGMALHHQFRGDEDGMRLWDEFSKRSTYYDHREIAEKWESFRPRMNPTTMATLYAAARDALGEAIPPGGESFDDIPSTEADPLAAIGETPELPSYIEYLNKRHAVANVSGKAVILNERPGKPVTYSSATDFAVLYSNYLVKMPDDDPVAATKLWMRHEGRRQYLGGVTFVPGPVSDDTYNLWTGWAVKPDPTASCALFLDHLRTIICAGNEDAYSYAIRWLAHLAQRPAEKPGVAFVMRGDEGIGKDIVGHYIEQFAPRHYVNLAQPKQLTGNFNAHLQNCLILHAEETFWAGDRAGDGVLKNMITAPTIQIEPKGVNAFQVPSCMRVIMSSNAEWVVPASKGARRYFVLDVSPARKEDETYFRPLVAEMEGSGPAGLLAYLLAVDLTGFNVRKPVATSGLAHQKTESLRGFDAWLYELLQDGSLPKTQEAFEEEAADWLGRAIVTRDRLYGAYETWNKGRRFDGNAITRNQFGIRLGIVLRDVRDLRKREGEERVRCYDLPPLSACRTAFEGYLSAAIEWQDSEVEDDLLG